MNASISEPSRVVVNEGQRRTIDLVLSGNEGRLTFEYSFLPVAAKPSDFAAENYTGGVYAVSGGETQSYTHRIEFETLADQLIEVDETVRLQVDIGGGTFEDGSTSRIIDLVIADTTPATPTAGNDLLNYREYPAAVTVSGLAGNDTIIGGSDHDVLSGNAGADRLLGEGGRDVLRGGDGTDTLNGGSGNDTIYGGASSIDLRDIIYGGDGDDKAEGGYGNDALYGGTGNDNLAGGYGVDEVYGQEGNDTLSGSAWSDLIFGGDGFDFINGGYGNDRLNGGAGGDKFYHVGVAGHGSDWMQDYAAAEGDVLVYGGDASSDQFQVNVATTEGAGAGDVEEAFVIYRPTGQILWALVDGAGQNEINLQLGGQTFDLL